MADGEVGLTTGDGDGTKPQVGGLVEAVRKGVSTSHLDSRHSICMFREEAGGSQRHFRCSVHAALLPGKFLSGRSETADDT